ncbi:uncharacterized protein [Apostichopus japonicus]|uniref:uncharacterized protein n=1 Tax=Stichopus japonicus TaxID=307972 RepID=UPI003AB54ECF
MDIVFNVVILIALFSITIFGRCPDHSTGTLCSSCENNTADCSNRCIGNSPYSNNYLTHICEGIYDNIDLSFNKLIRCECPVSGPSVISLNISHNNISFDNCSNWEGYCGSFFRRLRTIDLSYNRIQQTCNASAFGFIKLESVNLSHNEIKSLDSLPFVTSAKRLQTLDVSHNMITCVPSTFFIERNNLIKVDLRFNFIQKIALHFDISDQRLCDSDNKLCIIISGEILSKLDVSLIIEKSYTCAELRNQTLCDGTLEYLYPNSNNLSCNSTSKVLESTFIPSNIENQLACRCQGNICEQNESSIQQPSYIVSCVNIDVTNAPLMTTVPLTTQPQDTSESTTQTGNTKLSMNVVIFCFFFVVIFMVITIVFVCLSFHFVTKNVLETAKHCPQDYEKINHQYGPKLCITANLGLPSTQNTPLFEEYDEIPFAADGNRRRSSVSDGKHTDESLDRSVTKEQPIDVANLARDDVMCCEALPIVQTLQRNPSETEIDQSEINIGNGQPKIESHETESSIIHIYESSYVAQRDEIVTSSNKPIESCTNTNEDPITEWHSYERCIQETSLHPNEQPKAVNSESNLSNKEMHDFFNKQDILVEMHAVHESQEPPSYESTLTKTPSMSHNEPVSTFSDAHVYEHNITKTSSSDTELKPSDIHTEFDKAVTNCGEPKNAHNIMKTSSSDTELKSADIHREYVKPVTSLGEPKDAHVYEYTIIKSSSADTEVKPSDIDR